MEISRKIIDTVRSSLNLLCESEKEKDIQDVLGVQLGCKVRQTLSSPHFPNVEVDLLGDTFALEVKYNRKYYAGVNQVLVLRNLYDIAEVFLLHLHSYLDAKFINAFTALAEQLGFIGILVNEKEQRIEAMNEVISLERT